MIPLGNSQLGFSHHSSALFDEPVARELTASTCFFLCALPLDKRFGGKKTATSTVDAPPPVDRRRLFPLPRRPVDPSTEQSRRRYVVRLTTTPRDNGKINSKKIKKIKKKRKKKRKKNKEKKPLSPPLHPSPSLPSHSLVHTSHPRGEAKRVDGRSALVPRTRVQNLEGSGAAPCCQPPTVRTRRRHPPVGHRWPTDWSGEGERDGHRVSASACVRFGRRERSDASALRLSIFFERSGAWFPLLFFVFNPAPLPRRR